MKITILHKTASELLGCDWNKCNSACCRFPFGNLCMGSQKNNPCLYLTDLGCIFSMNSRPISCLLFPFVITKSNTLILHLNSCPNKNVSKMKSVFRGVFKADFICSLCYGGDNLPAIQTHIESLGLIFGYEQLLKSIPVLLIDKEDVTLTMKEEMFQRWQTER